MQVCWDRLPPGAVALEAGGSRVEVEGGGGPGSVSLDGLPPDAALELTVTAHGQPRRRARRFRTLPPPPGRLLSRFATVNDLHIGERGFGLVQRLHDDGGPDGEPYPVRCARAAVREAVAWGADTLVAKGDLTWSGRPGQWETIAGILGSAGVPVHAVPGNHDTGRKSVEGGPVLRGHGVDIRDGEWAVDLAGIRVVMVDSTWRGHSRGELDEARRARVAALAAGGGGPAFVALHHYPQPFRLPHMYPAGLPADQARALLDALAAANPSTLVATGHSHRHRVHRRTPVRVAEVGATLHYPGTWAGYAVHEGGIRQVVRRVAAPEAMAWTERTRRVLGGLWGWWASGRLADRCFTLGWAGPR